MIQRFDVGPRLSEMAVHNGVAYLAGFKKTEADRRVIESNYSKFNEDGTPVILDGGKIGKSARYTPPDLTGLY